MKLFSKIYILLFFLFAGTALFFIKCRKDPPVHFDYPGWTVYNTKNSILPNNYIYGLLTDNLSNVWISSGGYLIKFKNGVWEKIVPPVSDPDVFFFRCGVATEENIWLGRNNFGLYKFNITNNNIIQYTQFNSNLSSNSVECIAVETKNDSDIIWIGTANGLNRFNGFNWTSFFTMNSPLTSDEVRGICVDAVGNKWINVEEHPAVLNDSSSYIKLSSGDTVWNVFTSIQTNFPVYGTWGIVSESNGAVWITSVGVDRYFQGIWNRFDNSNSPLPNDIIKAIAVDINDKIWMGTFFNGIMVYDHGQWEHFTSENSGLPSDTISCLVACQDGSVWIGTQNGLAVYKKE